MPDADLNELTDRIIAAQVLTDLKAAQKRVGLLINFNVPVLRQGLKRMVNDYQGVPPRLRVPAFSRTPLVREEV